MKILLLINDAPYGSEKAYNALRLVMALQKDHADTALHVFLMADAVAGAVSNQTTPQGYYNIERMFKAVIAKGAQVKVCSTCCDARGLRALPLIEGIEISTMDQLAQWVIDCDRILVF
ncbi:hypothetical protein L861_14040 [Litchfieldella anticariensis FP35 = DSM 16096]|uniref:Uncharacterized protein n=1 Tax=Litchfieldella anticariensis (strain DSM 16096 / CECT 5854 / CIP 108499 / LMG 22089 / FP35) TaxID=1121939 RepID=S2KEW0_LITA3|nr:DsrE family protein [Halomonas anticariensis]EPC00390.1 hypothetical protein L861_14040 [Halomonas anticariensis FP35 = DSM 16096]